ncbi:MAG: heavy metal translocating P-type ATPase [Sphaerochaeta sp.]|jgi:Cd2+/Zn2+-exporting ATPase|nr:heavy metal translocating P-type ATPase [Sphaerochaeta sp.]PKL29614.1 MAG: cadmium-translocating P-type ATPase [Spirochaetae bacterium HGW-Spirochaetae-2]
MSVQQKYRINGVDCSVCAVRIQDAIAALDGVGSAQIDLLNNKMEIVTDHAIDRDLDELIADTVRKAEPGATLHSLDASISTGSESLEKKNRLQALIVPSRIVLSLASLLSALSTSNPFALGFFLLSYLFAGYDVVYRAIRNMVRGNLFDENFLMTIATVGAFAIGEYAEAVAVMAFYQVGEYFQDLAVSRSRASISKLMDIKPVSATVIRNGAQFTLAPEELVVGDTLLVRPGEKIPVDAIVLSGSSSLDTKALTGESLPRNVGPGDALISGCVNGSGVLHARATNRYIDSTVATILRLVEESGLRKAKTERFITRFAKYYTPIVVLLAAMIAILPPLFGPDPFSMWLYRALVFLVISCPCALVISVPLGFFGGIGGLAKMGVLVKGGNYIQALARTGTIVFDKTGTLTHGRFSVTHVDIRPGTSYDAQEILMLASAVETHSTHPIAKAISEACTDTVTAAENIQEVPGRGISGSRQGKTIRVGTEVYLRDVVADPFDFPTSSAGPSVVVAVDDTVVGRIRLADTTKREAIPMVGSLKKLGIVDLVMLSGDTDSSVSHTANELGIGEFYGQLLPQDKIARMEQLLEKKQSNSTVVFVGDGVNDAPVLARADVGISMGAMGSDAAVEASDIVIMTDDLSRIPAAIGHARKTVTIVTQNIVFALAVKGVVMALGAAGIATMWLAVFADTGVALLAVLNSLRALKHD